MGPAPRGTGLVAAPVAKKFLGMAGLRDVYTSSSGHTRSTGNFVKALFQAIVHTSAFMNPEQWDIQTTSKVELERQKQRKLETEHAEIMGGAVATGAMAGLVDGGAPPVDLPAVETVTDTTVIETAVY